MTALDKWAARWSVSRAALADLRAMLGAPDQPPPATSGDSEAAVQSRVRLEASSKGLRLWRNNVGAVTDATTGRMIRYGLANDSPQLNARIKSSDLIGIRPLRVRAWDIGRTIGQFVAREVKSADWRYTGYEGATAGSRAAREWAQLNYLELVASMGGDAAFAVSDDTL